MGKHLTDLRSCILDAFPRLLDILCRKHGTKLGVKRSPVDVLRPARIDIQTGCGSLVVGTAPGNGWRLDAGSSGDRTPLVEASARGLTVDAGGGHGWHPFDRGREAWRLTLPAGPIESLSLTVNAGKGDVGLAGAQIGRLSVTANASQATLDMRTPTSPAR